MYCHMYSIVAYQIIFMHILHLSIILMAAFRLPYTEVNLNVQNAQSQLKVWQIHISWFWNVSPSKESMYASLTSYNQSNDSFRNSSNWISIYRILKVNQVWQIDISWFWNVSPSKESMYASLTSYNQSNDSFRNSSNWISIYRILKVN